MQLGLHMAQWVLAERRILPDCRTQAVALTAVRPETVRLAGAAERPVRQTPTVCRRSHHCAACARARWTQAE